MSRPAALSLWSIVLWCSDGQLIVDGRERPWSFSLRDPVQVEVSQLDRPATAARIAYAVAVVATLLAIGHYSNMKFPGP